MRIALEEFYSVGYELGRASGSWVTDGNTTRETYEWIAKGYDEGDPEVFDLRPNPLSGEWAGESIVELFGFTPEDDDLDLFEDGFAEGFWEKVLEDCAYQLDNNE